MPYFRVNGVRMHVKLSGPKKNRPLPCCALVEVGGQRIRCEAMSSILCDWPVDGGTCDAPMCSDHAVEVGADKHYCPIHMRVHNSRQEVDDARLPGAIEGDHFG